MGPGMSLSQGVHLRPELTLKLQLAQQAYQARLLEMSDIGHEAWLAQQLRENPALRRRASPPRMNEGESGRAAPRDDNEIPYDYSWTEAPDLEAHLLAQLSLERTSDDERAAAEVIIQNLDRFGLLLITLEEVAEMAGVDEETAEDGQAVVMDLEPEGCGAADIQAYLIEMIKRRFRTEKKDLTRIVGTYLDELANKQLERIARLERMELSQVEEYAEMIRTIPPFPAQGFAQDDPTQHIAPTVFIERRPDGTLSVDVQDPPRSRIELNRKLVEEYLALPDGPEKRSRKKQFDEAQEVLNQVEHRFSVLARVANDAVTQQTAFFLHGDEYMVNLTMEDTAQRIHEKRPNISRAVKARYYQYEGKVHPLRELFTHRGEGNRPSKNKLHAVLRDIVAHEDTSKPMSDSALAEELKKRGFQEARRTVAKHRELAGIPAVHLRKKTPG